MSAPYQLFDPLPVAVEDALRASIQRFGVLVPVVTDQHGDIIDGHHRKRIADELKVKYRVDLVTVADDDEAREIARTLNADRRQLTEDQRRQVAADLRAQGHSVRAIAGALGSSKSQIQRDLSTVPDGTVPERVTGLDGKSRPARRALMVTARDQREAARAVKALAGLAEVEEAALAARPSRNDADVRRAQRILEQGAALPTREIETAAKAAKRAANGYEYEQRRQDDWRAVLDALPELARFADAGPDKPLNLNFINHNIRPGWTGWGYEAGGTPYLEVKDFTTPLPGQDWHWPRYTGTRFEGIPDDENTLTLPLFDPDEWDEFVSFDELAALRELDFEGSKHFSWWIFSAMHHGKTSVVRCPTHQRDYDPAYGGLIAEHSKDLSCDHLGREPGIFVRRGWGEWWAVEFNDGHGGRERRRHFVHDHACGIFVEHAYKVVDPLAFAHENLREIQQAVYHAMPIEMSWAYARHQTIDRDIAVAALEDSLDRLRQLEPLEPDEIHRQAAEFMQDYTPAELREWRQGMCTTPRRADGTVDEDTLKTLWDGPG